MEAWIRSDVHYFLMTHHIKSGWENPCDVTKSRDHAISPEILAPAVFGNFRIVCRSYFALNFDSKWSRFSRFFLNDWFLKLSVHCWCQSHQESFPTILVHVNSKNVRARVCVYVFGGRGSCARIYEPKKINKAKKNNTNNIGTYRETEEGGGEKPIKNIGDISRKREVDQSVCLIYWLVSKR